jgi:large subunit ribosomal protein L2
MSLGMTIHNIEITLGKVEQLARAASVVEKVIAKEGKSATLKLFFEKVRLISKNCSTTVEQVGNVGANQKSLSIARAKCWLGKRLVVRRSVVNSLDHPHGVVVKKSLQLVEKKNSQLLGIILKELEKGINIMII